MLDSQNLPAIPKVLDVPYRTLWEWINESEENRQRYDETREEQFKMIRLKIDQNAAERAEYNERDAANDKRAFELAERSYEAMSKLSEAVAQNTRAIEHLVNHLGKVKG